MGLFNHESGTENKKESFFELFKFENNLTLFKIHTFFHPGILK